MGAMHSNHAPLIRTIVYVDSFNLYCGALKRTSNKWLGFGKLFTFPGNHGTNLLYFRSPFQPSEL